MSASELPLDPIIVALDCESPKIADGLVEQLGNDVGFYKVGMELYAAGGMSYVKDLLRRGKRVFLDLKLYDIGETVKRAVAIIAQTDITFLTVHAVPQVVRAALEGRGSGGVRLLAVTVLTSLTQEEIEADGHTTDVSALVSLRARNALDAGADGLITSPLEAGKLRGEIGPEPLLITPGVRSAGADAGDQKRIATPREALRSGANYIVVGRQVTRASDPAAAAGQIRRELA